MAIKQLVLSLLLAGSSALQTSNIALPTVIFHGFGDACENPGMANFTKEIGEGTGAYATCIEIGNGASTSIWENFETQAEEACSKVLADPHFNDGPFNAMGLS